MPVQTGIQEGWMWTPDFSGVTGQGMPLTSAFPLTIDNA